MTALDATGLLKAERYLRFHDLATAPGYSDLTVWVDGAEPSETTGPAGTGYDAIDRALGPVRAVETGPGLLRYRVIFRDFVAFSVRNESFALPEEGEDLASPLRLYRRSRFLDFVQSSTFAEDALAAQVRHIGLVTLDQVVDVSVLDDPEITATEIGPDDPGQRPDLPRDHV